MQVPWEDLCYLFGEIMYGGHITDDWDRRLCKTYLEEFMHPKMVSQCSSKNKPVFYAFGIAPKLYNFHIFSYLLIWIHKVGLWTVSWCQIVKI